jgi:tetratricopeptide (TPR) repeat protein
MPRTANPESTREAWATWLRPVTDLAYDTRAVTAPTPLAAVVQLRPETDAQLVHAQVLADAGRLTEAARVLVDAAPVPAGQPRLALRLLQVESWLALGEGRVDEALDGLQRARAVVEGPAFTDADRAETLFRLGACQLERSSTATAISLLTLAIELFERGAEGSDRLRPHAFVWRARCYQRRRDWCAARADVERALELAEDLGDVHTAADALFQASLIAEREGQHHMACYYAEEARSRYASVGDELNVARLTNKLGGLTYLLGWPAEATRYLEEAHGLALELGDDAEAAKALSSLAQVHVKSGEHEAAELRARQALDLLGSRAEFVAETGEIQLILGHALAEQDRFDEAAACFHSADQSFERMGSLSRRAGAWMAQGELAARRGPCDVAAAHYRRAAEALQDSHF